jgi:hypothetical protein
VFPHLRAACVGVTSSVALADRGILHLPRVGFLKNKACKLVCLLLISPLSLLIFNCLCLGQGLLWGGANASALAMGSSRAQGLENVAVLEPIRMDVEAPVLRVALLEGELVEAH